MVLLQQIAQSFRPLAKVFQNVAAQLNAGKSKFRDLLDGLCVVAIPGNCRVPEVNASRRRGKRPIKKREIDRRVKRRWFERARKRANRNCRGSCDCTQAYDEITTR